MFDVSLHAAAMAHAGDVHGAAGVVADEGSGAGFGDALALSSTMAPLICGYLMAKVPPKPQHWSVFSRGLKSTFRSGGGGGRPGL